MTIHDQIRDEKLRDDINREAAEISAWSSRKIDKYYYLTGEKILPSNQKQIIEQAKFTYCPFDKAFEKQIKPIEEQGERQIKAIQNQGEIKTIQNYAYSDKGSPLISKQKEMFNKLVDKRLEEITNLDEKVNPDDLICRYKSFTADAKFNEFDNAFSLLDKFRCGQMSLADAQNDWAEFKSNLCEIKKRKQKHRSKEQKNTLHSINAMQSTEQRYWIFWLLFFNCIQNKT